MRAKRELRLFLSVAAIVLLLAFIFFSYAQQQDTVKSSVPALTEVAKKFLPKAGEQPKKVPDLPGVEKRFLPREQEGQKEIPSLSGVERKFLPRGRPFPLEVAQLPEVGWPEVREFKDFKGGLDLSTYKTKVPLDRAIVLENALWNEDKEMYKRPGYDTLKTTPEVFNFIYKYYQQDGDKYLMGGSDTALYFWEADSSAWTYLIGTEGTSGRWDGTTFEDMFVGTHEGIMPVVWDGGGFISMGVSADSFQVIGIQLWSGDSTGSVCSIVDSIKLKFDATLTGWIANEWEMYILGYWAYYYTGPPGNGTDTVFTKSIIRGNTDSDITIYSFYNTNHVLSNSGGSYYAKIYSWFGIDSVWREGKADLVERCQFTAGAPKNHGTKITDASFSWDSTFSYHDYIFEVVSGEGEGKKCFLRNHQRDLDCDDGGWDSEAFVVPAYHHGCFDTSTYYRIYLPTFTGRGAKYVENFDEGLWIGWTGIGGEQNKNEMIYSEPSDLGNWPPENQIYLPEDGDYITGMKSLSDARHVDVPSHLLMATKNASSYKIIPTPTAGLYDSWYISTRVGCVSNSAMSVGEGLVLFPDQSGVWAWDQRSKPQSISLLIDPIFEDLALANLEDMSAIYNPQDRHYYLSSPELFDEAYPGGEFICVFEMDSAQSKDGFYVHHFDSEGNEVGDDLWQFYYTAGDYLDIATKADGEYAIMYKRSSGGTGYKVFMAFFDEDGAQIGDTLRIDDGGEDTGYAKNADHKFAMNGAGQIIACWTDTEGAYDDVRCQCVGFDEGLVGSNFNVNSDHASNIDDYVSWGVGINEEGVAVMAWQDQRDVANVTEIYAQRFQYPDSLMGSNFRVNKCWTWSGTACVPCEDNPVCDGANCCENELKPVVAVGPRTFVIAWVSDAVGPHARCAGASCLYKRAYNLDGTAREDEYLLSDCTGGNIQEPSVSINSKGHYVIAYDKECGDGATYAIYMTAFDSSDGVHLSERQVSSADEGQQGPDVVINNNDIIVVVWYDGYHDASVEIAYRSYDWNGTFMSSDAILSSSAYCQYPEIDCFLSPPDTSLFTLAWNIDYHGWSKESFSASAYAYQHGLTDPVKVLFADPEETKVYNYGTQADDVNDAVILTYQSSYVSFVQNPSWDVVMSYATLEAFLDTGEVYVYWYKDYSELVHVDTISCGTDCREEIRLPSDVTGHNISMKIITGAEIDDFTLSGYWWEYLINRWRN